LKQKTVWLSLFALASVIASAEAADLSAQGTSSESSGATEAKDPPKFWVDTGVGGSNYRWIGGFAAITYAPFSGGMDESGPRVRIDSGYGSFYYYQNDIGQFGQAPSIIVDGRWLSVTTSVGYAYVSDGLSASGYIGANYQHSGFSASDTSNPTSGSRGGVAFSGDADYRPIKSWSIMAVGAYSTANNSWFSLVGVGYEVSSDVFLGPEVTSSGNDFSRRISAGGRLRGIKVGAAILGVGAGFQYDTKIGNGGYGSLQLSAPF
jgi:hypothetical protein